MNLFDRFVQRYGRLPTERDPDYLEMLRMSKYRILPIPDVGPAFKCANCGAAKNDGRGYVDFGLQVDWYGVVYLCTECLRDIAEKAGLFRALELKILQLEEEQKRHSEVKLSIESFQAAVLRTFEEVKENFVGVHSTGDYSEPSIDDNLDFSSNKSSEPGLTKSKQGAVESPTIAGRKDVPKLADLLEQKPK